MTALEARHKSLLFKEKNSNLQFEMITISIADQVKQGNFVYFYSLGIIKEPVLEKLKQLGYQVDLINRGTGIYYEISW